MGSGSSSGVPRAACLLDPDSKCVTCKSSLQLHPEKNKNYRGNVSLLIRFAERRGEEKKNILV